LVLILVQVFASCFAGVYNEYLIKDTEKNSAHIMIQNVFMYIDSIICNIILLLVSSYTTSSKTDSNENNLNNLDKIFSYESLTQLLQFKVILIILNNAAIGIVTSLFLKSLNSILKAFASALELMFTAVLSWIIFDIPLDFNTFLAILIVSFSTWLYSRNPVHNPPKLTINETKPSV
jgi:solute carrier family 35 (UDP-sugar transporter), member A1/2/3